MSYCLPQDIAEKLKTAVLDGRFDSTELIRSTQSARTSYIENIVGRDYAKAVNEILERKMLLKDQKAGIARAINSMTEPRKVKTALLDKMEKMEKLLEPVDAEHFFYDLAEKQLGYGVTYEETTALVNFSKSIKSGRDNLNITNDRVYELEKEMKMTEDSSVRARKQAEIDSLLDSEAYRKLQKETGQMNTLLQDYMLELQQKPKGIKKYFKDRSGGGMLNDTTKIAGGITRGLLSTGDFSAILRQGWRVMPNHPVIWARNSMRAPIEFAKELWGIDASAQVRSEIAGRRYAIDGRYQAGKFELGLLSEEAFPDNPLNKLPKLVKELYVKYPSARAIKWPLSLSAEVVGRTYKAFETAYTSTLLRMRADVADYHIAAAERLGVDMLDPKNAEPIGSIVNTLTGRGHLKMDPGTAEVVNVAFFAPRLWKSHIQTLTAHSMDMGRFTDSPGRRYAKRQAKIFLLRTVLTTASILALAREHWGEDAVETDSRSTDFGRIKIGATRFDVSGGLASNLVLAMRLQPLGSYHNGEWGLWSKSATTGKFTKLNENGWGRNGKDVLDDYIENKASPLATAGLDYYEGEHFDGSPVTLKSTAQHLTTPIPAQTYVELKNNPESADLLWSMIFEEVGVSVNTY